MREYGRPYYCENNGDDCACATQYLGPIATWQPSVSDSELEPRKRDGSTGQHGWRVNDRHWWFCLRCDVELRHALLLRDLRRQPFIIEEFIIPG